MASDECVDVVVGHKVFVLVYRLIAGGAAKCDIICPGVGN